jgi:uncharacterized repeat protein (TIGR04052 family)
MTMVRNGALALGASLGAIALLATPAGAATKTQKVDIRFAAVAGEQQVGCGLPIEGLGSTNQTATLADFRFFVSDVKLVRSDGRAVAVKLRKNSNFRVTEGKTALTLIDLENGTGSCAEEGTANTNDAVLGTVPKGKYVGVRWSVGVPFDTNHTDAPASPAPLNSAAMAWSWQSGRKFTKIEVTDPGGATGTWTAKTFFVHLGSGGCTGNPATGQTVSCRNSNRASVSLKRFDAARQRIAVDLKTMLAGSDITRNGSGAPGCMSGPTDPECGGVFGAFGIDLGTGASPASKTQSVFRAIAK